MPTGVDHCQAANSYQMLWKSSFGWDLKSHLGFQIFEIFDIWNPIWDFKYEDCWGVSLQVGDRSRQTPGILSCWQHPHNTKCPMLTTLAQHNAKNSVQCCTVHFFIFIYVFVCIAVCCCIAVFECLCLLLSSQLSRGKGVHCVPANKSSRQFSTHGRYFPPPLLFSYHLQTHFLLLQNPKVVFPGLEMSQPHRAIWVNPQIATNCCSTTSCQKSLHAIWESTSISWIWPTNVFVFVFFNWDFMQ